MHPIPSEEEDEKDYEQEYITVKPFIKGMILFTTVIDTKV